MSLEDDILGGKLTDKDEIFTRIQSSSFRAGDWVTRLRSLEYEGIKLDWLKRLQKEIDGIHVGLDWLHHHTKIVYDSDYVKYEKMKSIFRNED